MIKLILPFCIVLSLLSFQQDSPVTNRLFTDGFQVEYDYVIYRGGKESYHIKNIKIYSNGQETDNGMSATETTTRYYPDGTENKELNFIRIDDAKFYTCVAESENLNDYSEFPLLYTADLKLRDVESELKMTGGVNIGGSFTRKDLNRKIVGEEVLKTEAGDFNCYKITGELEVRSRNSPYTAWFNSELGIIKMEAYDKKGKTTYVEVLKKIISE
jgi:hypothetical protein